MNLNAAADKLRSKSLSSYVLVMLVLVMAMQLFALPSQSVVRVEKRGNQRIAQFLPDMDIITMKGTGDFTYSLSVYYSDIDIEQTAYSITPGACIKLIRINHKEIPFKKFGGCDPKAGSYWNPYDPPVYMDLAKFLHNGRNTIEVVTPKPEFDIGPVILFDNTKPAQWIGLAMILVTSLAIVVFMERLTSSWITGYIIACGFCVYLARMSYLGANHFSMDLPGHVIYFAFIAQHWQIPKPFLGWSSYHAPLYYVLQAIVVTIASALRSFDALTFARLFSLGCFMMFIIFSALTLHMLIRNRIAYYIALILLVFYPSGIMFAARLDSNILFYSFYSACLYFMLRWLNQNNIRHLGIALMMLGLALATRTNSLILLPIIVLALTYHRIAWGKTKGLMDSHYIRLGILILCLGALASLGRSEYYHLSEHRHEPLIVGNIGLMSRQLRLEPLDYNKLFIPNIKIYHDNPLWNVWIDVNGRQYFWNSMLKSSMFGEFIWDWKKLATIMSDLLLVLIAFTTEGYILHRHNLRQKKEWWMCLATLAIPIAALMKNRVLYPYACSEDFRYIYPAIVSFCGLYGLVCEQHANDWRPFRLAIGGALCLAFGLSSAIFFML